MTVAENIALALGYSQKRGLIRWAEVASFATEALKKVDCDFDPTTRIESLIPAHADADSRRGFPKR
jgi:ribose transport system ATP-binding protein